MTTPMDDPMDRTRLTDATVELADLTSGETVTLAPDTNGDYVSDIPGVPGHDYRLTVSRAGAVYTSECRMLPAPEIAGMEFNWIKMPYDHVAMFAGDFCLGYFTAGGMAGRSVVFRPADIPEFK